MSLVSTSDSAKRVDINYRQSTDFVKTITVVNSLDSSNFDFTGYSANLYIRKFSGSTPLVTFGVGTGITLSLGQILLQKADDDAELSLLAVENYYYELELIDTGTLKRVWLNGKFSIHNNIEDQTPNNIAVTVSTDPDSIAVSVANYTDSTGYTTTYARNNSGATILKGKTVYISGATGQNPTIALAKSDDEATHKGTLGIVIADIANNSNGYVATGGIITGFNTSAFIDGDVVWLSGTTAGELTATEPVTPIHSVRIGVIVYSHVSNGKILVNIQDGFELAEIHDVLITTPTDTQVLGYEASSGLWKNQTQNINIDGGASASVYLVTEIIDGGNV